MRLLEARVRPIVEMAVFEDLGLGDVTTSSLVSEEQRATGVFLSKDEGVLAGLSVSALVFATIDPSIHMEFHLQDGDPLARGTRIAVVEGPAASILGAERVALNFLQRLSGIATLTARFVRAVEGYQVRIVETRKTTPGLRLLEKYAVVVGGGSNHRQNLADGVLIKDNHLAAAKAAGLTLEDAIARVRSKTAHTLRIEVEVTSLDEAKRAADAGAEVILLDNMPPAEMAKAVALLGQRVVLEASGGITLENVREVAATGVHIISVGALTHSAPALDISLEFELS